MPKNSHFFTVGDVLAQSCNAGRADTVVSKAFKFSCPSNSQFQFCVFRYSRVATHSHKRSVPQQLDSHTQSRAFTRVLACIRPVLELPCSIGTVSKKVTRVVDKHSVAHVKQVSGHYDTSYPKASAQSLRGRAAESLENILRRTRAVSCYCFTSDTEGGVL